ncbi:ABC transporter permease [Tumidithrix helvetica PCC 7403]|uniref:ABC transporter permease n=1 Tax=Tumidithrix helvetica TaxID=3457545 RepID=UPI003CA9453B
MGRTLTTSLGRILAIASNVFRETVREQVLYLTLLFTFVLIAAIVAIPEFSAEGAPRMIVDSGMAAIEVVSLIVAMFVGTNLVNKELEKRTIFVLIAKPMSRAEFILGKHLGISAVIATLIAIMTAIFIALMAIRKIPLPTDAILIANFFTFWQIMLVAAIAVLFGTFSSSLVAALLTLASYLVGNFSRDLLVLGEISKNASFQNVTRFLYLVLPDLSRANLKNEAVYGILPSILELFNNGVYILSYALLVLAIAILIFSRRQF